MYTRMLTDTTLSASFPLKWGKDDGRCQESKKEQAGTHREHWKNHCSEAASNKDH